MRLIKITIVLLLIPVSVLFSQTIKTAPITLEWGTYFGSDGIDEVTDIQPDSKGNLYFVCDRIEWFDKYKTILGKFDPDCKLLWQIELQGGYNSNICVDPWDNIIVGNSILLEKYSPNGYLIWKFEHPKIKPAFTYLRCDSEGNIYGRYKTQNSLNSIVKIDKDGKYLWDTKVGVGVVNIGIDSDENLLVTGRVNDQGENITNLYKLDAINGEVTFTKILFYSSVRDLVIDSQDNIIFAGADRRYGPFDTENLRFTAKYSNNGDSVFIMYHDFPFFPDFAPFLQQEYLDIDQNDRIFILGMDNISGTRDPEKDDLLIKKLDRNGTLLWKYKWGGDNNEIPISIKFHPPNTLYLSGHTSSKTGISYGNAYQKNLIESAYPNFGGSMEGFIAKFHVEFIDIEIMNRDATEIIEVFDLGKICLNETTIGDVTIKNFSDYGLQLKPPVLADSLHFSAWYLRGDSLRWNDTLGMRIEVTPTETGYLQSKLYIYCYETERILDSILVTATIVEPKLSISGNGDFGYVKIGKEPVRTFQIKNIGTADILLWGIDEIAYPFSVKSSDPKLPALLLPGDAILVDMIFSAFDEGKFIDTLATDCKKTRSTCVTVVNAELKGTSIRYELKAKNIDYGTIANCKTPIDTAVIVNCSFTPVTLSNAVLSNTNDYELLEEPPAGFVLNYLDTAKYVVKFTPQSPDGLKTCLLTVQTNYTEEPKVTIEIRGITESINLTAEDIDFGEVGINRDHREIVKVVNHSSFPVHIKDIIENEPWLEISPTDILMQEGEEIELNIKINLPEAIPYVTDAKIIIDDPCPDTTVFKIEAIGIKSSVEVTPILDYQETEYCDEKPLEILIRNTGKLPVSVISQRIEGNDKDLFTFTGTWNNIEILPDSTITETVIFKPIDSDNGQKTAQAINTIFIDEEETDYITELKGIRYEIGYEIPQEIDISARTGEIENTAIEIKNTGNYSFTIEEIRLNAGNEFSFNPDLTGRTLNLGESAALTISLYSETIGYYNDELYLKFKSDNCEYLDTIQLTGKVKIELFVSLPDTTGSVGNSGYKVPLSVTSDFDTTFTNLSYSAEIHFDTQLYNANGITKGFLQENEIVDGEQRLTLKGDNITISKGERQLTELIGTILLGDSSNVPLRIIGFEWDNPLVESKKKDGSIEIEEICVQRFRTVQSFLQTTMQINPNPASEKAEISIISEEQGTFILKITDLYGKITDTKEWVQTGNSRQEKLLNIDISNYSPGLYQFILTSPAESVSLPIVIAK